MSDRPETASIGGAIEGAERTERETALWVADRRHPDQIIFQVKDEADFRGREVVTNDGYAQGYVDTSRDIVVGSQFKLNAQPNWPVLSRLYSSRFDEKWADEFQQAVETKFEVASESDSCWFDAAGKLKFSELIRLGVSVFSYTGEVLATSEWLRSADRPFSTALQMVAPTRLSNPNNQADTATLRRGIARDSYGRPVAYYIRQGYRSEFYALQDAYKWTVVDAAKPWGRRMVIHITDSIQPDQSRGISSLVAVLKNMRMTKKFSDVVLQNAIINASYAATLESDLPHDLVAAIMGGNSGASVQDAFLSAIGGYLSTLKSYAAGSDNLAVDGAKIPILPPGTTLTVKPLGTPGGVGTDYEASLLRHIAAGLGISYEEFSADYSRTNYSSARASMLKTSRRTGSIKKFVADRFANEIYALWLEEDMNAGNMPLPRGFTSALWYQPYGKESFTACDWIASGRGQIDELKETQAAILRIHSGLSSKEIEIARFGGDWRKLFAQLSREQKLADSLGLVFSMAAQKDTTASAQSTLKGN